ncbi:unnamed protein product [Mycena citricolor]|uniref:Uncharacterized protein n=1 Tax=Mycena citricolor TaxID=2018698 RepID=A0AAD2K246_9AGAR|nr:unnamed protein product [Mycena citricolor]
MRSIASSIESLNLSSPKPQGLVYFLGDRLSDSRVRAESDSMAARYHLAIRDSCRSPSRNIMFE